MGSPGDNKRDFPWTTNCPLVVLLIVMPALVASPLSYRASYLPQVQSDACQRYLHLNSLFICYTKFTISCFLYARLNSTSEISNKLHRNIKSSVTYKLFEILLSSHWEYRKNAFIFRVCKVYYYLPPITVIKRQNELLDNQLWRQKKCMGYLRAQSRHGMVS